MASVSPWWIRVAVPHPSPTSNPGAAFTNLNAPRRASAAAATVTSDTEHELSGQRRRHHQVLKAQRARAAGLQACLVA